MRAFFNPLSPWRAGPRLAPFFIHFRLKMNARIPAAPGRLFFNSLLIMLKPGIFPASYCGKRRHLVACASVYRETFPGP